MCTLSGRPGSGFSACRPRPSLTNTSRKPNRLVTRSPSFSAGLRDFSTRPSAPPPMASPSFWSALIRGRIAGSTDM